MCTKFFQLSKYVSFEVPIDVTCVLFENSHGLGSSYPYLVVVGYATTKGFLSGSSIVHGGIISSLNNTLEKPGGKVSEYQIISFQLQLDFLIGILPPLSPVNISFSHVVAP